MWVLLLVILHLNQPPLTTFLKAFETQEECKVEQAWFLEQFDLVYPPAERDYAFVCQPARKP